MPLGKKYLLLALLGGHSDAPSSTIPLILFFFFFRHKARGRVVNLKQSPGGGTRGGRAGLYAVYTLLHPAPCHTILTFNRADKEASKQHVSFRFWPLLLFEASGYTLLQPLPNPSFQPHTHKGHRRGAPSRVFV